MPGTRPGMTITIYIKNLRQGRACPGHPRPAGILVGWLSSFFRILLANARLEPIEGRDRRTRYRHSLMNIECDLSRGSVAARHLALAFV
jgi:hypothetical protein